MGPVSRDRSGYVPKGVRWFGRPDSAFRPEPWPVPARGCAGVPANASIPGANRSHLPSCATAAAALTATADRSENCVDIRPRSIIAFRKPVRNDAVGSNNEYHRMRDPMHETAGRVLPVQQAERSNDVGFSIREKAEPDTPAFGETRQRDDRIVAQHRDAVSEGREIRQPFVPGDRLALAVRSPVERSREQQDEAGSAPQRLEALRFAVLIRRGNGMGNRRPHRRPQLKAVMRGGGRRRDRQEENSHGGGETPLHA